MYIQLPWSKITQIVICFFVVLPTSTTNVGLNIKLHLWKHWLHSDINLNISRGSQANQRKTRRHFRHCLPKVWDWRMHSTQILFTQTHTAQTKPYLTHDVPDHCLKAGSKHSLNPKPRTSIMLPSPARWLTAERLRKSIVLLQERMKRGSFAFFHWE